MKLLLVFFVLVSLLLLSAIMFYVAGTFLPDTRSGQVTRTYNAAPGLVRTTILDATSQPQWRKGIAAVEATADKGWTEIKSDGERIQFQLLADNDTHLALGFESSRGYFGRWEAELRNHADGGTTLTVRETATTPSPLGRILSRLFFDPEAFAETYLSELEAELARRGHRSTP